MPIEREGSYLVTRDFGYTAHIGLESNALAACIAEAQASKYKGVFGSPAFGFEERTLDSLRALPDLESIWFWEVALEDVDAVYALKRLQRLGIHPRRPALDFCRLPSLKQLVLHATVRDSGIQELRDLDSLHVWHYLPKSKTFADLRLPPNLRELQINWANPAGLEGLEPAPGVKRFEMHRCRNLVSLAGLPDLFPNLEHLVITACGKVSSQRERALMSRLPRLVHAYIQDAKVV